MMGEKRNNRYLAMFFLILAAEMIFSLPFHVVRYFRPTFMEVFDMSNAQLGDAMAIYGVTAMISYFPGGVLADRFSARTLMSLSLLATSLGGFYMMTIPDVIGLGLLFGYWGVTTIFLFWGAMMKATREWGGKTAQGRAFGLLDGGRGLLAALVATLGVFILARLMPVDVAAATDEERLTALRMVILYYTALTMAGAILVWFFVPVSKIKVSSSQTWKGILKVARKRATWLQAIVVVCAYSGYRGLDFYSLYGTDILGMDEVSASKFVSLGIYLRPVGAIAAGFLADHFSTRKMLSASFILLVVVYLVLSIVSPNNGLNLIIFGNLVISFLAVYALRGIYFALFEEMKVSGAVTGTTVGLVSFIGYTPDIFFNSIGGRIIDASPGLQGYHNYFLMLVGFAVLGMLAASLLRPKTEIRIKTNPNSPSPLVP